MPGHKDQKIFDASNKRQEDDKTVYLPGMQKQLVEEWPIIGERINKMGRFQIFFEKVSQEIGSSEYSPDTREFRAHHLK